MGLDIQHVLNTITLALAFERAMAHLTQGAVMDSKLKNTQELLDLILDGISVAVDAEKDGKIDLADAGLLLRIIPDLGPAVSDLGQIPSEISHMAAEDGAALVTHVMAKLSIADAHARNIIDASLKAAIAVGQLVSAIKGA